MPQYTRINKYELIESKWTIYNDAKDNGFKPLVEQAIKSNIETEKPIYDQILDLEAVALCEYLN